MENVQLGSLPGVKSAIVETFARIVGQTVTGAQRQQILGKLATELDASGKAISRSDALLLINAVQQGAGAVPVEIRGRPRSANIGELCSLTPEAGLVRGSAPATPAKLLVEETPAPAPAPSPKAVPPLPAAVTRGAPVQPIPVAEQVQSTVLAPDRSRRTILAVNGPSFVSLEAARSRFLEEYQRCWAHPFVRYGKVNGKTFVFVGTMRGRLTSAEDVSNVHFKINDTNPKDHGATSTVEEPDQPAVTVWVHSFPLNPGDKLRFWCNVAVPGRAAKDVPDSKLKVLIHPDSYEITPN